MLYKIFFFTMVLTVSLAGCGQTDNTARIEALEDQIKALNARIDTLEGKNDTQKRIEALESDMKDVKQVALDYFEIHDGDKPVERIPILKRHRH